MLRDFKLKTSPKEAILVISAPGSLPKEVDINSNKETNEITVYHKGTTDNEDLKKCIEEISLELDFELVISIDKKYNTSAAKSKFVAGYIIITIPTDKEKIVAINGDN